MWKSILSAAALAFFAGTSGAVSQVWVVDEFGAGDFADIQQAVSAAADGDVILVKEGNYNEFIVSGKGLSIVGEGNVTVDLQFPFLGTGTIVTVLATTKNQPVFLRNIDFFQSSLISVGAPASSFSNTAGPIVIEDCSFGAFNADCLRVINAASLTLRDCTVDPGLSEYDSFIDAFLPRIGIWATNSNLYLYDSEVKGSLGPDAFDSILSDLPPGAGGDALRIDGGTAFTSGSTFLGGAGGSSLSEVCFPGENGGDALDVRGGTARVRDSVLTPGTAGEAGDGCPDPDGVPGQAVALTVGGQLVNVPGAARSFSAVTPVAEGNPIVLEFGGQPGDQAFLFLSGAPSRGLYIDLFGAALHLKTPLLNFFQGTVPASGVLTVNLPAPFLAPGTDFARLYAQGVFADGLTLSEGGPSLFLVLDDVF